MSWGKIQELRFESNNKVFVIIKEMANNSTGKVLEMDITKEVFKRSGKREIDDSDKQKLEEQLLIMKNRVIMYGESSDGKSFTSGQLLYEFFPDNQREVRDYWSIG